MNFGAFAVHERKTGDDGFPTIEVILHAAVPSKEPDLIGERVRAQREYLNYGDTAYEKRQTAASREEILRLQRKENGEGSLPSNVPRSEHIQYRRVGAGHRTNCSG